MKAERGDEALRRFRISQPGTDYFITATIAGKSPEGLSPASKDSIRRELLAIEADYHWRIRGAVIMPDHLHLLVTLGGNLGLSRVMARLKSKTRSHLMMKDGLTWQPNFYEHAHLTSSFSQVFVPFCGPDEFRLPLPSRTHRPRLGADR